MRSRYRTFTGTAFLHFGHRLGLPSSEGKASKRSCNAKWPRWAFSSSTSQFHRRQVQRSLSLTPGHFTMKFGNYFFQLLGRNILEFVHESRQIIPDKKSRSHAGNYRKSNKLLNLALHPNETNDATSHKTRR